MIECNYESMVHHLKPRTILNKKYFVGNVIGEGGFGITYIGLDTMLDIKIAIKEYFPNGYVNRNNAVTSEIATATEKQRAFFDKGKDSFLVEARSIAKFSQEQGIVDVRDYFEENGTAYIIMEYLEGQTLADYVKQNGNMDAKQLFMLMKPVMKSLQKVHSAGIVHRDISPDNIMYLKNGTFKLMDFGAARHFTNEEKNISVVLKMGYAPEEQYRKNGVQGPWTDVYGMCATMYRCITGEVPEDALDRLHADNLKKPSELGMEIPRGYEVILMYGLAVHRDDRCKDMAELLDLIDKVARKEEVNLHHNRYGAHHDLYKTQAADDDYRTQAADERYEKALPQKQGKDNVSVKPRGSKLPLVILCICTLIVMAGIFVIGSNMKNKDEETSKPQETTKESEEELIDEPELQDESQEEDALSAQVEYEVVIQDATAFTVASASSCLPNEGKYNYSASNVLVNDASCWCEGAAGYGIGEWIKLELPTVQRLSGLKIINGYAGGTLKQYNTNSKVTEVMLQFSDGQSITTTLNVFDDSNKNTIQYIEFNHPVETSYVILTIKNVMEGECEDTCLTYVEPY